jgi:hypothetical protein
METLPGVATESRVIGAVCAIATEYFETILLDRAADLIL